jgi:hypothetical protein
MGSQRPCACPRCRLASREANIERLASESLSVALRHAQEDWESTKRQRKTKTRAAAPRRPKSLPGTDIGLDWARPIAFTDLAKTKQAALKAKGKQQAFVIGVKGERRPLYVGHIHGKDQTVIKHVSDYLAGKGIGGPNSDTARLHRELERFKQLGKLQDVYVQAIDYSVPQAYQTRGDHTGDLTRSIEGLTRAMLNPIFYDPNVTSFEDETDGY